MHTQVPLVPSLLLRLVYIQTGTHLKIHHFLINQILHVWAICNINRYSLTIWVSLWRPVELQFQYLHFILLLHLLNSFTCFLCSQQFCTYFYPNKYVIKISHRVNYRKPLSNKLLNVEHIKLNSVAGCKSRLFSDINCIC